VAAPLSAPPEPRRVGVISDTHDLVRPEALHALAGSDLILHAGDVCGPDVLEALREIAPVIAVRGNNDHGRWAQALPETATLTLGGVAVVIVHDLATLAEAARAGAGIIISGHSHDPRKAEKDGVLFFNPGSAGPRRFRLPISLGRLDVTGSGLRATLVDLEQAGARA
jgi:putative phosphoesterase